MASTRLNKMNRDQIARELLEGARRDKEIEEARKEMKRIADQIYFKAMTPAVVKQMYSLPEGWLPTTDNIQVKVGQFSTKSFELTTYKRIPWCYRSMFGGGAVNEDNPLARDDELVKAHEGQEQHIDTLREEYRKIKQDIRTVLEGCNTTKQLIEVWPEIEHIVRKYEKSRHVRALPAKPVADLNRELGLKALSGSSQSRHKRIADSSQQPQTIDNNTGNVLALPSSKSNAA